MTNEQTAAWLRNAWATATRQTEQTPDPEMDGLVNSDLVSIRYAVITQLLGKHADHRRNALCLQSGKGGGAASWDARNFCRAVVVPWVQETNGVLGTSPDPYVGKPLRRRSLDEQLESLRSPEQWRPLEKILRSVEERNDSKFTEQQLHRCLHSIARRFATLNIAYSIPQRASLNQVLQITSQFLAPGSGGERPLIISTALMRAINEEFSLFSRIESQKINQADAASGAPGDILCYQKNGDEQVIRLAVEVKDRELKFTDLNSTIGKARKSRLSEVLFVTPKIHRKEENQIISRIQQEYVQGTSIYHLTLEELIRVTFALAGEECRINFLRAVGAEIDRKAAQPSLKLAWAHLLSNFPAGT